MEGLNVELFFWLQVFPGNLHHPYNKGILTKAGLVAHRLEMFESEVMAWNLEISKLHHAFEISYACLFVPFKDFKNQCSCW